jgi:hypothetical protein
LLAQNDAAQNNKDRLLLHHLGPAYGGNCRNRQASLFPGFCSSGPWGHLIDASLTPEFKGA